ncbi:hypothetical protein E3O06_11475 [Cryobacterium glaciale]|uniref:Uncharacterized protein n=1 Tax=Cryobacterium glaciale TaxID=1259145 RepID=A0A4R8UTT0_9MICO|nr:hypothetical protein E3O06_11475 [Cryobacterium glaciale]
MSAIFVVLILLIVVILVLSAWLNNASQREVQTQVTLSPQRAADVANTAFNTFTWKDVGGPGDINKRRRTMNDSGPVISIDVADLPSGGSNITVWMSAWTKKGPTIQGSDIVMRQRSKIIKRLEAEV